MQFADDKAAAEQPAADVVNGNANGNVNVNDNAEVTVAPEEPIEVIKVNEKVSDLKRVNSGKKQKHKRLSMLFCGINKKV